MNTARFWLAVAILLAGLLDGAGPSAAGIPAGVATVAVSAGQTTGGIVVVLGPAGSISGTVTSSTGGKPLKGAKVRVFGSRYQIFKTTTAANGSYSVNGLAPASYRVCAFAHSADGGPSPAGYAGRCHGTSANWIDTNTALSGATRVGVAAGQHVSVKVALPSAAAISGRVSTTKGARVAGVSVQVFERRTHVETGGATTGAHGRYRVANLPVTSDGYLVCFDGRGVHKGEGYLTSCFHNVAWSGNAVPSAGTKVTVSAAHTHAGVNGRVATAGAVTGTITSASAHKPLAGVYVEVWPASGAARLGGPTAASGHYVVTGLRPGKGYRICAFGADISGVEYAARCWRSAAWTTSGKPPPGAAKFRVMAGKASDGHDIALPKAKASTPPAASTISGTVTDAASGKPIDVTQVDAFEVGTSPVLIDQVFTDAAGHYAIPNLGSGRYDICVAPDRSAGTTDGASTPATGWAPRCYGNIPWDAAIGKLPVGVTPVKTKAGTTTAGIDVALTVGGAISGEVRAVANVGPTVPVFADVDVFDSDGRPVAFNVTSSSSGDYTVNGLLPSAGYVVCVQDEGAKPTHAPQCYSGVPWGGL